MPPARPSLRVMSHREEETSHPNLPWLFQALDHYPHPSCLLAVWQRFLRWNTIRLLKKSWSDGGSYFRFLVSSSVFLSGGRSSQEKFSLLSVVRFSIWALAHMDSNDFSIRPRGKILILLCTGASSWNEALNFEAGLQNKYKKMSSFFFSSIICIEELLLLSCFFLLLWTINCLI